MIKEAIDRIVQMAGGAILKDEFGRQVWDKTGAFLGDPRWPTINLRTLTALNDYLTDVHSKDVPYGACLHIESPTHIDFRGPVVEPKKAFDHYAQVVYDGHVFKFGTWYSTEDFIIALQMLFVQDDTTAALLKIVGNLSSDLSVKTEDDGVTQTATVKSGIQMVGNVPLPNPVTLRPFRTFPEVEQPQSLYVFRMRKDPNGVACALFDVGGNLWELEAIDAIKRWLKETGITVMAPVIG